MDEDCINYISEIYPTKLLDIKHYPNNIYFKGDCKLLNCARKIAIVGSRKCTEYGRKYARLFSRELSQNGICVASGLALGIDTAAHYGAVYEKGKTVAVLAGGIDKLYPKENKWLYNEILENGGCIISENECGIESKKESFPKRNRIIGGISDAVLVIEAEHLSGSKITAKYAKEQSKKVYCISSNIDNPRYAGIKDLIKNEEAKLVFSSKDLIEDLYREEQSDSTTFQESNNETIMKNIPQEYIEIYKAVLRAEFSKDELSKMLNCNIATINSKITMMELNGYIYRTKENKYKSVKGI